jgi:excisionase family DNA binding protein
MQTMTKQDSERLETVAAPRRMLTVKQVAEELGVGAFTVREWIRDGELPAIGFGNRSGYRIEREDLERFIDARRTGRKVSENRV